MRVSVANTGKPGESVYIVRDIYFSDAKGRKSDADKKKKRTTKVFMKLGKMSDLMAQNHMTRDEVIAWARETMAVYKAPRQVEFVEALPKSNTGKIMWRKLQADQNNITGEKI